MRDRATDVALFRYALVREAADPALSTRQRGRLVREIAARPHPHPDGMEVTVGRSTLDQWIRAWRAGGFEALKPKPRALSPKVPDDVLHLAEALKREDPARTAAHVRELLALSCGWAPNERTIQRLFRRIGLTRQALAGGTRAFGRFEASHPNELWVGDALHGPVVGSRKVILFAFVDDHSRLVAGHRWGTAEDTLRAEAALRRGLVSRGVPEAVYVDYADIRVTPTSGRRSCSKGVGRLKLSALIQAAPRILPSPFMEKEEGWQGRPAGSQELRWRGHLDGDLRLGQRHGHQGIGLQGEGGDHRHLRSRRDHQGRHRDADR